MYSEINIYKFNDCEFVFSVTGISNSAIVCYKIRMQDNGCDVCRIKNALSFLKTHDLPLVQYFSADYQKVVNALMKYCSLGANISVAEGGALARPNVRVSSVNSYYSFPYKVVSARPKFVKTIIDESGEYYELDDTDKYFISSGIRSSKYVEDMHNNMMRILN